MDKLFSFLGPFIIISFGYLLSENKKNINWRTVGSGLVLQFVLGVIVLKTNIGHVIFDGARSFFNEILGFSNAGGSFVFGSLTDTKRFGFLFFTMVLPTIIFMGSLMKVFYHWGIMQKLIKLMAKVMMKLMGTSGPESMAASANVFAGQTEAPLFIRPYIDGMTRSEVMALMTGGMATVAGGVLAAYVGMGIDAGHLLAASVMSAPAALVCAKLLVPEIKERNLSPESGLMHEFEKDTVNTIDAAAQGAAEGLKLAMNVAAMLIGFLALVAMINGGLGLLGSFFSYPELKLEIIFGYLFSPVAFLIGVPWSDAYIVGTLLGKKLVLNEFVAYLDLVNIPQEGLSPRSRVIATYALCGFSNFGSIAIQVGGIGSLAPSKRKTLAQLGIRSLLGGTMACLMTAAVAGLFT